MRSIQFPPLSLRIRPLNQRCRPNPQDDRRFYLMLFAVADCRNVRVTIPGGEAPATGFEDDIGKPWFA